MMERSNESLFCDGGTIGRNPSPLGGTFAWCLIRKETPEISIMVKQDHGAFEPADVNMEIIGNNLAELFAAVRALSAVPEGWPGTLWTDSRITLYRLTTGERFMGIPDWLRERTLKLRKGRSYVVKLLGGHPTREELRKGRRRDGKPVSRFNVWCDLKCGEAAELFRKRKAKGKP